MLSLWHNYRLIYLCKLFSLYIAYARWRCCIHYDHYFLGHLKWQSNCHVTRCMTAKTWFQDNPWLRKSQNLKTVSTLLFQLRKILSKIWTWTLRSVTINLRHHNCEYKTKIFLLRWNLGVKTADLSCVIKQRNSKKKNWNFFYIHLIGKRMSF